MVFLLCNRNRSIITTNILKRISAVLTAKEHCNFGRDFWKISMPLNRIIRKYVKGLVTHYERNLPFKAIANFFWDGPFVALMTLI